MVMLAIYPYVLAFHESSVGLKDERNAAVGSSFAGTSEPGVADEPIEVCDGRRFHPERISEGVKHFAPRGQSKATRNGLRTCATRRPRRLVRADGPHMPCSKGQASQIRARREERSTRQT